MRYWKDINTFTAPFSNISTKAIQEFLNAGYKVSFNFDLALVIIFKI